MKRVKRLGFFYGPLKNTRISQLIGKLSEGIFDSVYYFFKIEERKYQGLDLGQPELTPKVETIQLKGLAYINKMKECDIFITYNLDMLLYCIFYNTLFKRKKIVYYFMGSDISYNKKIGLGFRRHKIKDYFFKFFMSKVNHCICMSPYVKKLAIDAAIDEKKLKVIPNAFDTKKQFFYPTQDEIQSVKKKYHLDQSLPVILSVSKHTDNKNVILTLKAAEEVSKTQGKVSVWICGVGPNTEKLKEYALKHSDRVNFKFFERVPRDKLRVFYTLADVLCHTTFSDSGYNPAIEAWATSGLPLVCTKNTGNAYFMQGKEFCKIVNIDKHEVAQSIIDFITMNPLKIKNLRKEARISSKKFDFDNVMPIWKEFFERVRNES